MAESTAHTHFAVMAIQKMRAGEPIEPKSCTRDYFGPHLSLIRDMQTALTTAQNGTGNETDVVESMKAYWAAIRLDERFAEIVKAVDAADVQDAGRDHEAHGPLHSNGTPAAKTLDEVVKTFKRWLYLPDLGALHAYLGTIAANRMAGDPVWLMLIGGPGWGKTETLLSGQKLPHMHIAATLTEASLLSGTRKKERSTEAKGGLLRQIGPFGFLVLKDFTSVLSMNRDIRAGLLAALREIYDGSWTRHVGVDGGLELSWQGKLAVIGGCTGTIDRYHAVIGAMGERFVFYRWPEISAREQAKGALDLLGHERQMRAELSDAVSVFFEGLTLPEAPPPMTEAEEEWLIALASLVVRARSAVERDGYTHEIELIPDPEAPSRLTLTLARLYAGLKTIGVSKIEAASLMIKMGFDCLPALRWRVLKHLLEIPEPMETPTLATALGYPTNTAKYALEDLAAHGVVMRHKGKKADCWSVAEWAKTLYKAATLR
jgi:hypothetical protein